MDKNGILILGGASAGLLHDFGHTVVHVVQYMYTIQYANTMFLEELRVRII